MNIADDNQPPATDTLAEKNKSSVSVDNARVCFLLKRLAIGATAENDNRHSEQHALAAPKIDPFMRSWS